MPVNVIKGDTEDLTKSRNLCTKIIQNLIKLIFLKKKNGGQVHFKDLQYCVPGLEKFRPNVPFSCYFFYTL